MKHCTICSRELPAGYPICGECAETLEKLQAENEWLKAALKRCDYDCTYCASKLDCAPYYQDCDIGCDKCLRDVPCASCRDNSNWRPLPAPPIKEMIKLDGND